MGPSTQNVSCAACQKGVSVSPRTADDHFHIRTPHRPSIQMQLGGKLRLPLTHHNLSRTPKRVPPRPSILANVSLVSCNQTRCSGDMFQSTNGSGGENRVVLGLDTANSPSLGSTEYLEGTHRSAQRTRWTSGFRFSVRNQNQKNLTTQQEADLWTLRSTTPTMGAQRLDDRIELTVAVPTPLFPSFLC